MKKALTFLIVTCFVFSIMSVITLAGGIGDTDDTDSSGETTGAVTGTKADLDEMIADFESKVKELETKKDEYLAKKDAYDTLADDYYTKAETYKAISESYLNDEPGIEYEDVETAYDIAFEAYNAVKTVEDEANIAYGNYIAAQEKIQDLADRITELVDELNIAAENAYTDAMERYMESVEEFAIKSKEYLQDFSAYIKETAKNMAEYAKQMKQYKAWLKANPNYSAQKEAYDDWLREKDLFDALQLDASFIVGSKLINDSRATIKSYTPGNNSANGNKGKINPNDGDVSLELGLKVIAVEGSKQWAFLVDADAVGKEFIIWAHGNTAGEFIIITFNEEGTYLIGTSNGMNHLYLVGALSADPGDPGEKMDKPEFDPVEFKGERLTPPECKPEQEIYDGVIFTPWRDEIGDIVRVDPTEKKAGNDDSDSGDDGDGGDGGDDGSGDTGDDTGDDTSDDGGDDNGDDGSDDTIDNTGGNNTGSNTRRSVSSTPAVIQSVELPLTAPSSEISQEEVPLADAANENMIKEVVEAVVPDAVIVEENVPRGEMPKTGLAETLHVWVYGLCISTLGLGILLIMITQTKRKSSKKD